MPTQYSNFSNPDDGTQAPTGTGANGEVWNPSGGPNGTGGWGPPPTVQNHPDLNNPTSGAVWGNRERDTVGGDTVAGTSGMEQDISRYQSMANQNVAAPTLDQGVSNGSRDLVMGGLSALGLRAAGEMTPAQQLQQQQTTGAVNAVQSAGASVHGGAMARAAAGRNAIATGARVQAQGDQDQQALRAREMADAAGQYFGAAAAQRGQDLGVAQSNAGLEMGQRGANLQNNQFYEGLGYDTKNAQAQTNLGESLADQSAANAGRIANQQQDAANWNNVKTVAGTAAGGITGGVAAYGKTQPAPTPAPAPAPAPASNDGSGESGDWTDYNNSTSDERAKTNIRPVSDAEAARLSKAGDGMLFGMRAGLASGPAVHDKTAYDGKYLGAPFEKTAQSKPAAAKQSLDDAIGARVAQDAAEQPRYGYFDEDDGGSKMRLGGNPGYAASRADQPGGMFGAPRAESKGPISREQYERNREVMLSDDRTKLAAAWDEGHQAAIQNVHKLQAKRPEDLRSLSDSNSLAGAVRDTKAGAFDEGKLAGGMSVRHDQMATAHADMDRAAAESDARMAARRAERPQDPNDLALPASAYTTEPERTREPTSFTRGASTVDTPLTPDEEATFGKWKSQYAPKDSGGDYDLRGAFKAGIKPDPQSGHWPDTYKKPNHPTFSDESQYSKQGNPGHWDGETFIPGPRAPAPAADAPPEFWGNIKRARSMLIPSDKLAKNVDGEENAMAGANRAMTPSVYEYKPGFAEESGQKRGEKNVGPMAQNMAADPVASVAIVKRPDGYLAIDKDKGLKLVMGGLSDLQRQVDSMKGRRS